MISYITMRTTIAAIATLLATPMAHAFPQISPTSAASATVAPPSSYYLKTRVVGQGHNDKDGLYVSNYPTGTSSWAQSLCARQRNPGSQPLKPRRCRYRRLDPPTHRLCLPRLLQQRLPRVQPRPPGAFRHHNGRLRQWRDR